jgi:hypothetical protein
MTEAVAVHVTEISFVERNEEGWNNIKTNMTIARQRLGLHVLASRQQ